MPARALATNRYVANGGVDGTSVCTDPGAPCLTIGRAVTVAGSDDVIHIAAGSYDGGVGTDKRLTFIGAGAGTLDNPAGSTSIVSPSYVFNLTSGGTLRNMRVSGGSLGGNDGLMLSVDTNGETAAYDISGVIDVESGNSRAMSIADNSAMHNGVITANVADSTFMTTGTFPSSVLVSETTANFARTRIGQLAGQGFGLLIALSDVTFTDGMIGDPTLTGSAATVEAGSTASFVRTRFAGNNGLVVDGIMAPASAAITDSTVRARDEALLAEDGVTVAARGSTFDAYGPSPTEAAFVTAANGDASVTATNSIFRSTDTSGPVSDADVRVTAGPHSATFAADHSSYTDVVTAGGGTATPAGSGTNVSGDPGFLGEATGDFRLSLASPLLDRGAAALAGELDVTGAPRSLDSNCDGVAVPDIGAFELGAPCLHANIPAGPPVFSRVSMTHRRFRVGRPGAARAPKGTRFRYTLSQDAKVTVTVERKASGRRKGRRCVKPRAGLRRRCTRFVRQGALTKQSPTGANSLPFSGKLGRRTLKPGRYRARLVAVNAAGQRSKESRLSFTIVKR